MTQEFCSDMMQSECSSGAVYSVVPGKHTGDDLNQYVRLKLNILFSGKQHVGLAGRRLGKHVGKYPTASTGCQVTLWLWGSDLRQNGSLV